MPPQIQSGEWDISVDVLGVTVLSEKMNKLLKKVNNGKEPLSHLSIVDTAFKCCSRGEHDGGVSRLCLGAEVKY